MSSMPFSCDTAAAWTPDFLVFGKNSDRHVGERQFVESFDAVPSPTTVKMTYSTLRLADLAMAAQKIAVIMKKDSDFQQQQQHSFKHIVSRPQWMWGAEMAVNDKGLVIGNEAVFSAPAVPKAVKTEGAVLGMDALRAAVMFAETAEAAAVLICAMVEMYGGFSGDCGGGMTYHNSFLCCDNSCCCLRVLTLGKHWAVLKGESDKHPNTAAVAVASTVGVASISNAITTEMKHSDILWCSNEFADFTNMKTASSDSGESFRSSNSSALVSRASLWFRLCDFFACGCAREAATAGYLRRNSKALAQDPVAVMMGALRQHVDDADEEDADKNNQSRGAVGPPIQELSSLTKVSVCMHSGRGPVRENQTAQTLVVLLSRTNNNNDKKKKSVQVFATHAPNPCIAPLAPVCFTAPESAEWNRRAVVGELSAEEVTLNTFRHGGNRWDLVSKLVQLAQAGSNEEEAAVDKLRRAAARLRSVEQDVMQQLSAGGGWSSFSDDEEHDAASSSLLRAVVAFEKEAVADALWSLRSEFWSKRS